jgi:hypothetical protein
VDRGACVLYELYRAFPQAVQVILQALQKYGRLLADDGSAWYLSGAPPPPPAGTLSVSAPNGGEEWVIGTSGKFRWSWSNLAGNVKVELSRDGGGNGDFRIK